jgi:hypothetical protein
MANSSHPLMWFWMVLNMMFIPGISRRGVNLKGIAKLHLFADFLLKTYTTHHITIFKHNPYSKHPQYCRSKMICYSLSTA